MFPRTRKKKGQERERERGSKLKNLAKKGEDRDRIDIIYWLQHTFIHTNFCVIRLRVREREREREKGDKVVCVYDGRVNKQNIIRV